MSKKILVILEAGDAMPSGVVRGLIYKQLFRVNGYDVRFINRLSPKLINLSNNCAYNYKLLSPFFNLFFKIVIYLYSKITERYIFFISKKYTSVYLSKIVKYDFMMHLKKSSNARLILDFGDSVWLNGKDSDKFHKILQLVDAVSTDNELTAEYVKKYNHNCVVIPDHPQIEIFDDKRFLVKKNNNECLKIGWIGSPSTAFNLFLIFEELEQIFLNNFNLHLRLVGTGNDKSLLPPFEKVKYSVKPFYSQNEMIEEVLDFDIGLFPLYNIENSVVRGILKATIYMSAGVPFIASPIGQIKDFIKDGENGMLAKNKFEWIEKLELLIRNTEIRNRLASNGLETIRKDFSLEKNFRKLISVISPEANRR